MVNNYKQIIQVKSNSNINQENGYKYQLFIVYISFSEYFVICHPFIQQFSINFCFIFFIKSLPTKKFVNFLFVF